jgi:hypothetical protein
LTWAVAAWLCVTGLLSGLWIYGRGDGMEWGGPLPPAQRVRLQQWQNLRDRQLPQWRSFRLLSVSATLVLGVAWLVVASVRAAGESSPYKGFRRWDLGLGVLTLLLSVTVLGYQLMGIDPLVAEFIGDRARPWDALESTWRAESVSAYLAYLGVAAGAIAILIWGR